MKDILTSIKIGFIIVVIQSVCLIPCFIGEGYLAKIGIFIISVILGYNISHLYMEIKDLITTIKHYDDELV